MIAHQGMVERVVDLQVLAGVKLEKERPEAIRELSNPKKYTYDNLEALRKTILEVLTHRTASSTCGIDYRDLR